MTWRSLNMLAKRISVRCGDRLGSYATLMFRGEFLSIVAFLLMGGAPSAADPVWVTVSGNECPLIRKDFKLPDAPKKAVVRIVGLGHFVLHINGQRAGDAVLHQPWSQYDKSV